MKKLTSMVGLLSIGLCLSTFATTNNQFNSQQKDQIEQIVYQYLVSNPKILLDVSAALQKQQQEQLQADALKAIKANKQAIFNDKTDPVYGNPKGNVTVVEFYDYQCGHCKRMSPVLDKIVADNKNVKIISKDFPIFGENSIYAAKASIAAYQIDKDKYVKFHQELMAKSDPLDQATVEKLAQQSGYNVKEINKIVASKKSDNQINDNMELAKAMKLSGTPAFIIANKDLTKFLFLPGAASETQLQEMINSLQ